METGDSSPAQALQGRPRLLELAATSSVPLSISKKPLSPSPCPTYVTEADRERANTFLSERRAVDPEYKAPKAVSKLFKKKAEIEKFDPKEINRAFAAVIDEGGPLGLVEALHQLGGDVNVARKASKNTWKKLTRSDQQDRRSDVLSRAAQTAELDMVRLLASHADQTSLDDALPCAIERGHLEITKVLLEYGADPTEFHEQFLAKISEGKEDMVELLMQGPKRPCMECRATGLITAAEKGSLRNCSALLLNEADADYQTAAALQRAVKNGRNDLAIAITTGQKPPCSASLDVAISVAYAQSAHDLEKKISLIEICLCGGAKGDHTAETLLKATEEKQAALIDLLLLYGASVDYKGGAVIKHAILEVQKELLVDLLKKEPSAVSLSNAMDSVMTLSDLSVVYEITELLLTAGAKGDAVARALITAVKLSPDPQAYKLIQLLLERGSADVDFEEGKAIQSISAAGILDVLQLLLASKPAVGSLNAAFPFAMEIQSASTRQEVVGMLLQAGAVGLVVDQALVVAAKTGADGIPLAKLLLSTASVDFEHGRALCEAIKSRCLELVQTIVAVKPSLETLTAAWAEAVQVEDHDLQYNLFQILLELGMNGDAVSRSLVVAATKGTPALGLSKLLLKHGASVDYNNGEALVTAVQHGYIDMLELLLSATFSKASLTPSLATAQALKDDARLAAVAPILRAGVEQEVCDAGLLQAVQEVPSDSRLIKLFLDAEASPDFSNGGSFLHAAGILDLGLLEMLAPASNSKNVATDAFGVVFQSGDSKWRTEAGLSVARLLIKKGATGEHINKAAVQAALMFDDEALELVAEAVAPKAVFTTAFIETTGRDDWVSPEGLTIIQSLLEKGATGSDLHVALYGAARAFNFEALQLLSTAVVSPEAYTLAFSEALNFGDEWLLLENLDVIELLLEHGACGETVHGALLEALDAYASGTAPEALVDLLLHYKADVNYDDGEAIQIAASSGDVILLKKLFSYGATKESISRAFSMAIVAQHEEKSLLALIDAFMENPVKLDPNFVYPGMEMPPLLLCLQEYPESVTLTKRMCDIACNLEVEIKCDVYDDEIQDAETVTPLVWALFQPENMISVDVITTLLKENANPNYITNVSKTTPLHIAAKYKRSDVVAILLKHGAKVSARDIKDRSALFYASRNGDTQSISAILKAKPGPNDGSLQEAARELHPAAITLLIKGGHHPDFTSTKHDGRTALAELALCCESSSDVSIDDTIDALVTGKVDPLKKCRGKTPLYLALENPSPFAILQKLLERIYWKYVNDFNNLYVEEDIYYSPTMYVANGFLALSQEDSDRVLKLLRQHEAADIYYAKEGLEQPPDAIGMPEKIVEFERKKKLREEKLRQQDEDHQRALMREAETAGLKAQIKSDEHEMKLHAIDTEQKLKFSHTAAANRQRLEAQAQKKLIDSQAAREKLDIQKEATRVKLLEGQAKLELQRKAAIIKVKEGDIKLRQQAEAAKIKAKVGDTKVRQQKQISNTKVAEGQAKTHQQIKAARAKAVAGDIKLQQHVATQRASVQGKLVQHKIKMQELEAKRQQAKMKRLK